MNNRERLRFAAGFTLPYVAVIGGWAVADAIAANERGVDWWESASNWVYLVVAAAVVVGAGLCWPLIERAQRAAEQFLAAVVFVAYVLLLLFVNFVAYTKTSAPFP